MRQQVVRSLVSAAAWCLVPSLSLEAQSLTAFSNLGPGDSYNACSGVVVAAPDSVDGDLDVAYAFTPAFDVALEKVELAITHAIDANGQPTGANELDVAVMTDAAGQPGAVVESFRLSNAMQPKVGTSDCTGPTPMTINSITRPVLASSRTYWIVVSAPGPATVAVWNSNSTGTVGIGAFRRDLGPWVAWPAPGFTNSAFRVTGTGLPDCRPPTFVFADTQNAVPIAGATLDNESFEACQSMTDVRISNHLTSLWLGVERIRTQSDVRSEPRPVVDALTHENSLESWAQFGVIPPCRFAGVFDPECEPGRAWWRASFAASGTVRFTASITPRAALLTLIDLLFSLSSLGVTPTELMEVADDLDRVPTIHQAARCLVGRGSVGSIGGVRCAAGELLRLTTRFRQQRDIVRILASYGINAAIEDIVQRAVGFPIEAAELGVSLSLYGITAGTVSEDPGALTVKVVGR